MKVNDEGADPHTADMQYVKGAPIRVEIDLSSNPYSKTLPPVQAWPTALWANKSTVKAISSFMAAKIVQFLQESEAFISTIYPTAHAHCAVAYSN